MKLEKGVVSKDLSVVMKKLGCPQDSHFCWYTVDESEADFVWVLSEIDSVIREQMDWVSAYTVAEMGEILRKHYVFSSGIGNVAIDEYFCEYASESRFEHSTTEADARSKMWIYLKKEKLI